MKEVFFPLSNYYGKPYVECEDNNYYICLEDWNGANKYPISKEFYDACVKEFKSKFI